MEPAIGTGPAIAQAAATIRFLGKTPLSASVKQAAEALRYTEDKATVILITDGLENCNADPCALGADTDNNRHVLAEAEVEIVDSEVALVAPNTADAGGSIPVEWKGPGNEGDYIDLVPAGYKETNGELSYVYIKSEPEVELRAPTKAGNYLIRYILNSADKRRVLASIPLEVTAAVATLSLNETAEAGAVMSVFWTGPASSDDYIDIVPIDHKRIGGELSYFRPSSSDDGESGELSAPTKAGEYVVRSRILGPVRWKPKSPVS